MKPVRGAATHRPVGARAELRCAGDGVAGAQAAGAWSLLAALGLGGLAAHARRRSSRAHYPPRRAPGQCI